MDYAKIGQFISKRRKELNLTQKELAAKLFISDKAVSKWERGLNFPSVDLIIPLCNILNISINDLLSGGIVDMKNNQNNEQLLLDMAKELEKKNKTIWSAMWAIMIASICGLFGGVAVAAFLIPEGPWQLVTILVVCLVFLMPCLYALKLEVSVGAYKCKNCGREIVPTYKEALNAMHMGTTRYLKCPNCHKRTWCKKVVNQHVDKEKKEQ